MVICFVDVKSLALGVSFLLVSVHMIACLCVCKCRRFGEWNPRIHLLECEVCVSPGMSAELTVIMLMGMTSVRVYECVSE